jgi:pimeloyl-ACP methyl ester carboxylesterase
VFHEQGRGRAVVLLHSSMSSKNQWRALEHELRARYRVISIDLLGYGDSAMPRGDYRLADEVRHVERILGMVLLPGEPYHLVGHSYGGVIALHVAQRALHRLASLTLLEPVAVHLMPADDPARLEFHRLGDEVLRHSSNGDPATAAASFIDYWGTGFATLPELKQRAFARLVPKVLMEFRALALDQPVPGALLGITAPVCLVYGSLSPAPMRGIAARLATLMPRARCVRIEAGHMAPVTHPELVNPVISQFLGAGDRLMRDPRMLRATDQPARPAWPATKAWAWALAICLTGLLCAWPAVRGAASGLAEIPVAADGWRELPAAFPRAGRYAVVSGDPRAPGAFVLRVELGPGFELPPHRTSHELQLVVLSGELSVGGGTPAHPTNLHTLGSGYFARFGERESWFARTERGATLQVFGLGPIQD